MSKVLYEKRGRIAYITLNRPETLNAVDDELDGALWKTWADFNADEAFRLGLVNRVVPDDQLMVTAEELASQILQNSQQAIRSAKETILEIIGRTLDDALRVETLNAYSSVGDFSDVNMRLQQFYGRKESEPGPA